MSHAVFLMSLISLLISAPAMANDTTTKTVMVAKYSDSDSSTPVNRLDFRTEISQKYEYYDVGGSTPREIRSQMSKNGTKWDDGETYDALTTWEIKYRYKTATENGRCYVRSAKTDIDVIFRYPRWTPAPGTTEAVHSRWNTYMDHLRLHEIGHKDMAVDTAHAISEALSAMGSFTTCDELDKAASSLAQEKLASMKQAQKDYDSTTRHGETQGAVFP